MIIIVLTAMVLSVELILAACALLAHVPIPVDTAYVHSIVPCYQRTFHAQRDLFLYGLWIALGAGVYACLLGLIKGPLHKQKWDLRLFLTSHVLLVFLMAHSSFEIVTLDDPLWAWPLFWGAFAAAIAITVFWPEFISGMTLLKRFYASLRLSPWVAPALGCLFIFLVVYMPDLEAVVAMNYMGDYFHNWDVQLFGAVYAITKGLVPGVEVITTYGFGAAVMTAKIVHWMGGFDYVKVFAIVMWVGIIYFILWFLLLRRFLASGLLAFAAIVCAMRMEMFHLLVAPFVWSVVMASVFRYCFDIGIFWMLWMHIQTRRIFFLAAGAFFVSLGLYHLLTTGLSMFLMFGLYVTASAFMPALGGGRDRLLWRNHALVLASVFVWSGLWFYLTVGKHCLEGAFWQNLVEYNSYFIRGIFSDLLTTPLVRKEYFMGIVGLLYPVLYLSTFLYAAGNAALGRVQGRDVMAGLLALYGLEIHSYYIQIASQWYSVGMPGVFVFFYWIGKVLEKAPLLWRNRIAWGLVVAVLYCLVTDRMFTGYPNLLNFSRNPIVDSRTAFRVGSDHNIPFFHQMLTSYPDAYKLPFNSIGEKDEQLKFPEDFADDAALKAYYEKETSFPEDAALIRRLTPEGASAAVLSSFELLLLERADRKPFFYYYPLLNSVLMTGRIFMVTGLFSYPQVQKVIDQMETQKPEYVFMERIFLTPQVPLNYFYDYPDLVTLIQYVRSKYEPVETGKYLAAMKRTLIPSTPLGRK